MTTTAEVYFLVRTGMWGEDDLESYIADKVEAGQDQYYDRGYEDGVKDGLEEGLEEMYKQAIEAVKCLR
jgi:flagellar biosynthesis/type III secretory pathway protein FliH